MKILVIGSEGSTGKRYCKILNDLGCKVLRYDLQDIKKDLPVSDKVIIASPTDTHFGYYRRLSLHDVNNVLIEKPACDKISRLSSMFCKMVCNWAFVFPAMILKPGKHEVLYNYHNTGNEGYWFDTCQLHILSDGTGRIINQSSSFSATINDYFITEGMIEASYSRMISAWLEAPELIWNVQDIIPELSYIIRKHEIANE